MTGLDVALLALAAVIGYTAAWASGRREAAALRELAQEARSRAEAAERRAEAHPASPAPTTAPFIPFGPQPILAERLPKDIEDELARYPVELQEPTLTWIKEQRRNGGQWPQILMHLKGGRDGGEG